MWSICVHSLIGLTSWWIFTLTCCEYKYEWTSKKKELLNMILFQWYYYSYYSFAIFFLSVITFLFSTFIASLLLILLDSDIICYFLDLILRRRSFVILLGYQLHNQACICSRLTSQMIHTFHIGSFSLLFYLFFKLVILPN